MFAAALLTGFLIWGMTVEAHEPLTPQEELLYVVDAAMGLLLCVSLWWRRRWPVLLAILGIAVSTVSSAGSAAGLILLWTVATRRPMRTTAALVPFLVASTFVFPLVQPDDSLPYGWDVVLGIIILAVVIISAFYVRTRRQLQEVLLERARQAEVDRERHVEQARRLERDRIAREMHDVLGHRLSLVSMHAGALEFRPDASPTELAAAAGTVRRNAHQALVDLRTVLGVLRQPDGQRVRPQPTLSDLPALVSESRDAGLRIRGDFDGVDIGSVPHDLGRTAYRIVQEGLTNARKHAAGVVADVVVRGSVGDALTVEVRNPMPLGGRSAPLPGGTGLVGLTERAELAGGRLEYGQTRTGEFRLWASLPWPA